ncbi:MAG TPA: hypothetical protein VLT36_26390 [Candidatus Dormibacteraeota bacterium]|nr:hypothetical protein [Candidatus Dormibacteraeota bacterium]
MAIPILPILGAVSTVATTAWDTYSKIKRAKRDGALPERVDKLEETCLEQARMLSELSREFERFVKAMQEAQEEQERRLAKLKGLVFGVTVVATSACAVAIWLLVR